MCVLRLVSGKAVRQGRDECKGNGDSAGTHAQLPGWPAYREPNHPPTHRDPDARRRAILAPLIGAARVHSSLISLGLGPTCPTGHVEARSSYRTEGLTLRDRDRDAARRLVEAAGSCGSSWLRLRTWEDGPGDGFDVRLVCQTHCGTRYCEDCSELIRRRQVARVQGDWQLFMTLTMPQRGIPIRWAWDHFYNARRKFLRELRRESNRRYQSTEGKTANVSAKLIEASLLAQERIQGEEKIEYAWAIEPHESGYPHLHLVLNLEWIDFGWCRQLWSKMLGVKDARIDGRRVWSIDGVCNYLAKYISKRRMPLDILAIIKGRRTWACTLENTLDEDPVYWPEEDYAGEDPGLSVEEREEWGAEDGWTLTSGKDGCYARWRRPSDGYSARAVVPGHPLFDPDLSRKSGILPDALLELFRDAALMADAAILAETEFQARFVPE